MNREEAKDLLPIITAYANGERVQFLSMIGNRWEDIPPGGSSFGLPASKYRIKPEDVKVQRVGVVNLSAESGTDPWITSFHNQSEADDFIRRNSRGRNLSTFPLTGSYER